MHKQLLLLLLLFATTASAYPSGGSFFGRDAIPDTVVSDLPQDSVVLKPALSRRATLVRKAVVPASLILLGVTHMDNSGIFEGSHGLRRVVRRHYSDFDSRADDYIYHTPVALAVGLNLVGVKGEHHFVEQGLLLGMTHLLNRTITVNLKSITNVRRPDGTTTDAFPSAHTSTAFAYAAFFHKEYGAQSVWYSVAGFSAATATGAMRILNDRHWLSDVLVGAGIGILSAEIVYEVYPFIQKKVTQSYQKKQQLVVLPYFMGGAGGLALTYQLH